MVVIQKSDSSLQKNYPVDYSNHTLNLSSSFGVTSSVLPLLWYKLVRDGIFTFTSIMFVWCTFTAASMIISFFIAPWNNLEADPNAGTGWFLWKRGHRVKLESTTTRFSGRKVGVFRLE